MKLPPAVTRKALELAGERPVAAVVVPLPPSTNHLFATVRGRRIKAREYKDWLAVAVPLLVALRRPATSPFGVVYTVGVANPARDLGNVEKPLTDALVAAGVIADDSLRAGLWDIRLRYDPAGEVGVEVRVTSGGGA